MFARTLMPGLLFAMLSPVSAVIDVTDRSDAALPLPHILAIARHHVAGDVVNIELENVGNQLVYNVRILAPDGRLCSIKLDARSGAIIRIENR